MKASPLARRIAEEHGVDLSSIKTATGKIEKADVLAFVESRKLAPTNGAATGRAGRGVSEGAAAGGGARGGPARGAWVGSRGAPC